MTRHALPMIWTLLCTLGGAATLSAEAVRLVDPDKPRGGWSYHDGREFGAATGGLTLLPEGGPNRQPALVLEGDFSQAGNYVAMDRAIPTVIPETLSMWIKGTGSDRVTLRLQDSLGTTHQLRIKLQPHTDWQPVLFPVRRYFASLEDGAALPLVHKYEKWGPKRKQGWQPPLSSIAISMSKRTVSPETQAGRIIVSDIQVFPTSGPSEQASTTTGSDQQGVGIQRTVRLDEILQAGYVDWARFNVNCPGPQLTTAKDDAMPGGLALRFAARFPEGKGYAGIRKDLSDAQASSVEAVSMQLRSPNASRLTVRIIDATGQTHQRKNVAITADDAWHAFTIDPQEIAGGEHWGGAKDGVLHQPIASIQLILNARSGSDEPVIHIGDVAARVTQAGRTGVASYREPFELDSLPADWKGRDFATLTSDGAMEGDNALRIERPASRMAQNEELRLTPFPVSPGPWVFTGATRGEMHSPDLSFNGTIDVEWLGGDGRVVGRDEVKQTYNQPAWANFRTTLEAPADARSARFMLRLEKTYGWFEIDNLAASPVSVVGRKPKLIQRLNITTPVLGNLFDPSDEMVLDVRALSRKPLAEPDRTAQWEVRDYWGAEFATGQIDLEPAGRVKDQFAYSGRITLDPQDFEVGKFFEVFVTVAPRDAEPYSDFRGLARLPQPASRNYDAMTIPFGLRNWDPRVRGWLELGHRIGLRMAGTWTSGNRRNPDASEVLQLERFRRIGMLAMVGNRAVGIVEDDLFEGPMEPLRDWARSQVVQGGATTPYFNQGNEPHISSLEDVLRNREAYRLTYEGYKSANPDAIVIGPSIAANEAYFEAGIHRYSDTYNFHTYESYKSMPGRVQAYLDLGKKYGDVKPVFCTEMGLNAQGQTRYSITLEMLKKIPVFFAAGGAHASWFTINYPDPQGRNRGNSGDAFCMFDSTYNEFNPRLDAIGYYTVINSILDKRSIGMRVMPDATETYLFTNDAGETLQVIWNDQTQTQIAVPLPGVESVRVVRIDGSSATLTPHKGSVSLYVSPEPVYLLYSQDEAAVPDAFGEGDFRLAQPIRTMIRGESKTLRFEGSGVSPETVRVQTPPRWETRIAPAGPDAVEVTITAPVDTDARTVRVIVHRFNGQGQPDSELSLAFPVSRMLGVALAPQPALGEQPAGVVLELVNRGDQPIDLTWALHLEEQYSIDGGRFHLDQPKAPTARFAGNTTGVATLAGGEQQRLVVPLTDLDHQTLYSVSAKVSEATGESVTASRLMGGFAAARKAQGLTMDGRLDESAWANAPIMRLSEARQFYALKPTGGAIETWEGPDDLSAELRFLWDDEHLYVGVRVTDNVYHAGRADNLLWRQDGLQFLIDPARTTDQKPGKYDYSLGVGTKGAQVWRHVTASPAVIAGEATDITLAAQRGPGNTGSITYEIAFPWASLAPFDPKPGANLGLTMILNEDDGDGRKAFMGWFGGAHNKLLHSVGDLILVD